MAAEEEDLPAVRPRADYWLTRAILLRGVAFIYAVAFAILVFQFRGLIGSHGILPARDFTAWVREHRPSAIGSLLSLFWFDASDGALAAAAYTGLGLSIFALLGYGTAVVFALLWGLQLSFVSVGQIFWGYGWDMNASFDPLHLVNTYGAFGSVDAERHEVVLEGTRDDALTGDAHWVEYEFPCKPGRVDRRPCWVTPYHYRLDWQMWFAGHLDSAHDVWFIRLVIELLRGAPDVSGLLAKDPFRGGPPPRYVRALLYHYRFVRPGQPGYWTRDLLGEYLRPVSIDDHALQRFMKKQNEPDDE